MNALLSQAGSLILPGISVLIVLLLAQLLKSVRALPVEGEPLMIGVERQTIAYLEQAVPEARVRASLHGRDHPSEVRTGSPRAHGDPRALLAKDDRLFA